MLMIPDDILMISDDLLKSTFSKQKLTCSLARSALQRSMRCELDPRVVFNLMIGGSACIEKCNVVLIGAILPSRPIYFYMFNIF